MLTVLGSGSILPHAERSPAGYALALPEAGTTWLDAGPGTLARYGRAGGRLEDLRRIVLSHFHPDHCLDLAAVLFARRNPALSAQLPELEVIGPRGTAALLANLQKVWGGWVREEALRVTELAPRDRLQRPGYELRSFPTHHTDHALCFRIETAEGAVLAYSGDSGEVDELVEAARDADLFVCECSFPDDAAVEGHLTPASATRVALRSGARQLLLTHFYPSLEPAHAVAAARAHGAPAVRAALDGHSYALSPPPHPEATR